MRTLHLCRHLATTEDDSERIDAQQFAARLARSAERTVVPGSEVGPAALRAASESDRLLSSTLLRGRQTVDAIRRQLKGACPPDEAWTDLVEVSQPALAWPGLRLSAKAWSAWSRVAWAAGLAGDAESRASAMRRAHRVAARLEALAKTLPTLMVVGHGVFDLLLAHALRQRGWRGSRVPSLRHAHVTSYRT